MNTTKLQIACPGCGSFDISYSCSPACCFNHVCSDCYTTFEPVTTLKGGRAPGVVIPPNPLPSPADPAVACIKCDSTAVYMMPGESGSPLVCSACGVLLDLELTEVTPG